MVRARRWARLEESVENDCVDYSVVRSPASAVRGEKHKSVERHSTRHHARGWCCAKQRVHPLSHQPGPLRRPPVCSIAWRASRGTALMGRGRHELERASLEAQQVKALIGSRCIGSRCSLNINKACELDRTHQTAKRTHGRGFPMFTVSSFCEHREPMHRFPMATFQIAASRHVARSPPFARSP